MTEQERIAELKKAIAELRAMIAAFRKQSQNDAEKARKELFSMIGTTP